MLDIFSKNLVKFIYGMPLTLTCSDWSPKSKSMRVPRAQPSWGVDPGDSSVKKNILEKKMLRKKKFENFSNIFTKKKN